MCNALSETKVLVLYSVKTGITEYYFVVSAFLLAFALSAVLA